MNRIKELDKLDIEFVPISKLFFKKYQFKVEMAKINKDIFNYDNSLYCNIDLRYQSLEEVESEFDEFVTAVRQYFDQQKVFQKINETLPANSRKSLSSKANRIYLNNWDDVLFYTKIHKKYISKIHGTINQKHAELVNDNTNGSIVVNIIYILTNLTIAFLLLRKKDSKRL